MRTATLTAALKAKGTAIDINGVETITTYGDSATEYNFVRNSVGITDFSHQRLYRVPEETGIDYLDELFPGNVAQLRFGRVLHTFLPDSEGNVVADCFVCNNDDEILILCESAVSDEELDAIFAEAGGEDAGLTVLNDTHSIVGIDGAMAFKPMKEIFGTDILGLLYLSIERYDFEGTEVGVIRGGKTGEFGYLVIAEHDVAVKFAENILGRVEKLGGGLVGRAAHDILRLDGRFFNITAEGVEVRDPLKLGLQWMIDFEKDSFRGSEPLLARRKAGLTEKIVGIVAPKGTAGFAVGAPLYIDGALCGKIAAANYSPVLDSEVGLALLTVGKAYASLDLTLNSADGVAVLSVTMPPFTPKSLSVKLDEL